MREEVKTWEWVVLGSFLKVYFVKGKCGSSYRRKQHVLYGGKLLQEREMGTRSR